MRIRVKVPSCSTFSQFDDLVYQSIEINDHLLSEWRTWEIGLKGLIAIVRTAPEGEFSLTCFFSIQIIFNKCDDDKRDAGCIKTTINT